MIHKEADSDYGVSFPDLPGCVTAGATLDKARRMAEEVLAPRLEGLAEDNRSAPEPSSLEAVMADPSNRDGVAILVAAPSPPARSVRVNITLPADLLEDIDRRAKREGFTRSGFLAQAARKALAA